MGRGPKTLGGINPAAHSIAGAHAALKPSPSPSPFSPAASLYHDGCGGGGGGSFAAAAAAVLWTTPRCQGRSGDMCDSDTSPPPSPTLPPRPGVTRDGAADVVHQLLYTAAHGGAQGSAVTGCDAFAMHMADNDSIDGGGDTGVVAMAIVDDMAALRVATARRADHPPPPVQLISASSTRLVPRSVTLRRRDANPKAGLRGAARAGESS